MKIKDLTLQVAKKESLKKQVSIAQIKEVIAIVAGFVANDADTLLEFIKYGKKKADKK